MKRPHILITAGPTREMIDPVRFISNLSTGEMGYRIAEAALKKNFQVTLISGPVALKPPKGVRVISVVSASQMEREVKKYFPKCDAVIMTAAVCDYAPIRFSASKIKDKALSELKIRPTNDILKSVGKNKKQQVVVGFCLETENLEHHALKKLCEKNLDLMVANRYSKRENPFGQGKTSVFVLDNQFQSLYIRNKPKSVVARHIILNVERKLAEKRTLKSS